MRKIKLKSGKEYTFKELKDFPEGPIREAYAEGYVDGTQFVFIAEEIENDPDLKERAKIAHKKKLIG